MSVHEVYAGFEWLMTTLGGDATLTSYAPGGVWRSLAPPGTATPFVVFAFMAGSDVVTVNGFRLMVSASYHVRVSGPAANTAAIKGAASRIDALIGSPPTAGSVTGAVVLSSYRESPVAQDEAVAGELWANLGGIYRLEIEQTG